MSGGLDSAVLLHFLKSDGTRVEAVSFDYGQRHGRELSSARRIAEDAGVKWSVVSVPGVFSGSSQTGDVPVPHGYYAASSMKVTVVPNRNMVMLSLAAAKALSEGLDSIAFAAHAGDHAIYPDCRPAFVRSMRAAFRRCDWKDLGLLAPFLKMSKAEIVSLGAGLGVPFGLTWSCYEGGQVHCGRCGTCVERREAFQVSGVPDPTAYASSLEPPA